jgi:hypothetical protein
MRLPNKLSVAATVLGLGGLTGVAMSSGAGKRDPAATPAADIRTVEIQQTIHRYRHVGAGGSAPVAGVGGRVLASYGTGAGKVRTRASGHKASVGATHSGTGVKTGPSGKSGKYKTSKGTSHTAPKTRSSGTTKHESSTHSPASASPTTKPSGTVAESPTSNSPTAPPTTKPSGSTGETPSGGGTEKTPPPTTKPSGSGGETGGGTGGEKEGKAGEKEHRDD